MSKHNHTKRFVAAAMAISLACGAIGCNARDAVVDGFFGGISNTVATVITNVLLSATPIGGQP